MFANPKSALGFAGVTIAIAIAASFGASHFLPGSEQEPQVVAQPEEGAPPVQPRKQAATVAWADEGSDGGFSDDWNDSAVDTANGFNDPSSSSDINEMEQPSFGDFAPQSGQRSGNRGRPAQSSARASSSSAAPQIRSGAAPDAPELQPPGGSGGGEIVQVD